MTGGWVPSHVRKVSGVGDVFTFLTCNPLIRIIFSASLNIPIHCDEIRKTMRILNIEDQLKFQNSSLMWDYDNNDLPEHPSKYFKRTNLVHNYETRGTGKGNLFLFKS